jgi:hypothetical protein
MTLLYETDSPSRLTYNGYIFLTYSSKVSGRPVLDTAQRGVKYVEYEIEVVAHVAAEGGQTTTDTALEEMRTKLTQTGARLKYINKGLGTPETLDINGPGGVRDACWGPKPELLAFDPIGDSGAAMVTWRVKTWLPCQHSDTKKYRDLLVEFTYNCSHQLDEHGYSTINYSGRAEIAMTRIAPGNTAMPDHIDKYRELFKPLVPLGFRLVRQNYQVSDDKRSMDWSCSHEQIRDALPEGVTGFPIRHTVNSDIKRGFVRWHSTLGGTVIVPPNYSKSWGVIQFMGLLYERVRREGYLAGAANRRGYGFITDFTATNEVCGRGIDLHCKYWFAYTGTLLSVMTVSGVLESMPSGNFVRWRQSLNGDTWHPRGPSRVEWRKTDDFILDLCVTTPKKTELPDDPQRQRVRPVHPAELPGTPNRDVDHDRPPPPPPRRTPPPPPPPRRVPGRLNIPGQLDAHKPGGPSTRGGGQAPDLLEGIVDPRLRPRPALREGFIPTEEDSWTYYDIEIEYLEEKPRWAEHKPLKTEPRPLLEGIAPDVTGGHKPFSSSKGGYAGSVKERKKENKSEFQDLGTPTAKLYVKGVAERIGYRIPLPGELRVNGAVVKLNRVVSATEKIAAKVAGGVPVWRRTFVIEYLIDAPPRFMPVAANPLLPFDGQDGQA